MECTAFSSFPHLLIPSTLSHRKFCTERNYRYCVITKFCISHGQRGRRRLPSSFSNSSNKELLVVQLIFKPQLKEYTNTLIFGSTTFYLYIDLYRSKASSQMNLSRPFTLYFTCAQNISGTLSCLLSFRAFQNTTQIGREIHSHYLLFCNLTMKLLFFFLDIVFNVIFIYVFVTCPLCSFRVWNPLYNHPVC